VQTCRREFLDRTLIWSQFRLLYALREFGEFCNGHRRIRESRTPARSSHCPCRSRLLTRSPAFGFGDVTDSTGCFMSINTWHELHG
jgi:hypothetical protein